MKKITIILCLVAGLVFSTGCSDYLDSDYVFDERITLEDVFQNRDYSYAWLTRGYVLLSSEYLQEITSKYRVGFNFADDMYYGDWNYDQWKSGQYTEIGISRDSKDNSLYIWKDAYAGIRQVSIFINNIEKNKEFTAAEITDLKSQAHFLRAYFYWLLIRTYGPVPILPNEGLDYMEDYEKISLPRNTYDECADFISSELITAATGLPSTRGTQEVPRPTRGAALALRARVLLYAASPLYNGKAPIEVATALVNRDQTPLLSATYDESKWAKAAAAAKDVMELGQYQLYVAYKRTSDDIAYPTTVTPPDDPGDFHNNAWPNGWTNIDPFESYRSLFNGSVTAYENKELIFTRGANQGGESINKLVLHQLPRDIGGGYGCHGMTQKQCDAYYTKDGGDTPGMNSMYQGREGYTAPSRYDLRSRHVDLVTEQELNDYPELGKLGIGVSKQYAAREPRFYASVGYNASTWHLLNANSNRQEEQNQQIYYYRGNNNGYQVSTHWLKTGIGIKKFVHPNDISNTESQAPGDPGFESRFVRKNSTEIRYAEVLLIYAEALNELTSQHEIPSWDGSRTYSISRDINEMKKGIHPVRIRAGLPDYDVYDNADEFRIKIKRERQIEFFAECHRYFDLRRWCDAPAEESAPVYGCNVYSTAANPADFHTPVEVPSLPTIFTTKMWFWPIHYDELKRNKSLIQNPGWTYPE